MINSVLPLFHLNLSRSIHSLMSATQFCIARSIAADFSALESALKEISCGDIEDITCPRVDMNFIFEWSTRYLTSERSERVRYRVDHEKIKFISISGHVMFCLLYKHQWNTKPFYFNIFNGLKVELSLLNMEEVHGRKPNSFDKV